MSSATSTKEWASPEDWEAWKDIISRLWWNDDKPLKEVRDIMMREYDFHATDKMYKARFKSWGLTKNLKTKDAKEIMEKAKAGLVKDPLVIQGRSIGSKKWQKRLNKVAANSGPTTALTTKRNGSISPLSGRVGAPDILKLTEVGLQAIRDFTACQFEQKVWDLSGLQYDFDSDKTDGWSCGILLAKNGLMKDRNSPTNFAMVHKAFDQFGEVLDQATPALIPFAMLSVLELLEVGPEMADALLRFVAQMITIKLGDAHPLSRFWAQMRGLGTAQTQKVVGALFTAYFDIIQENSHPANRWRVTTFPHFTKIQQKWGLLSEHNVVAAFEKTIKNIEDCKSSQAAEALSDIDAVQMDRHLYEVKIYLSLYLMDYQRYLEADQISQEIGVWLQEGGAKKFPEQWEQWLRMKGELLVATGKLEEATPFLVATYHARKKRLGVDNRRTTRAMLDLEEHYRRLHNDVVADQLREEVETSWIGTPSPTVSPVVSPEAS